MKIYTLRCEMKTPASLQEAFSVFENPHNLAKITPPWMNFRITSREPVVMRKGAQIEYRIRWLGVPISWQTVITEYDPPLLFVDQQASGPYTLWRHRHTFQAVEGGALVSDTVEYALPFGWLGRLMHRLVVARQLREIFEFRQRSLVNLLRGDRAG